CKKRTLTPTAPAQVPTRPPLSKIQKNLTREPRSPSPRPRRQTLRTAHLQFLRGPRRFQAVIRRPLCPSVPPSLGLRQRPPRAPGDRALPPVRAAGPIDSAAAAAPRDQCPHQICFEDLPIWNKAIELGLGAASVGLPDLSEFAFRSQLCCRL